MIRLLFPDRFGRQFAGRSRSSCSSGSRNAAGASTTCFRRCCLPAGWTAPNLGDGAMREEVGRLLVLLAEEMVRTETLWRPADVHEFERPEAFRRAVAAGLLVVDGGRVGFSHQAWLDGLSGAGASQTRKPIAEFALAGARRPLHAGVRAQGASAPQVIRRAGLRGGARPPTGRRRTRRHLRHLVVDLVASQGEPRARRPAGSSPAPLRTDPALARRALPLVASRWAAWRPLAADWLPLVMQDDRMRGVSEALVAAEMGFDAASAAALIDRHWAGRTAMRWCCSLWSGPASGRLGREASRRGDGQIADRTTLCCALRRRAAEGR